MSPAAAEPPDITEAIRHAANAARERELPIKTAA